VDRLDAWLNAQRGWRRRAIIVAAFDPPTALLGISVSLFIDLWAAGPSGGPALPALAISAIAVLALPVAAGLGSVMAVIHARRAANPRRNRRQPPFFMWRMIAALWLMLSTELCATLLQTLGRPTTGHRVLAGLQLILAIALIPLWVETVRYSRRFTRPPATDQAETMPGGQFL
jgi:Na+/phosphate symporter